MTDHIQTTPKDREIARLKNIIAMLRRNRRLRKVKTVSKNRMEAMSQ